MRRKHHVAVPFCFALGSYTTTLTSILLSTRVWLSLFSFPPGTTVRPMMEATTSLVIAGTGSLVGLALAVGCFVYGRDRYVMLGLGVVVAVFALTPIPIARSFYEWVMQTQGLIPAD